MDVVGTATEADAALSLIQQTHPDVAILDVELPGRSAFEIAAEMAKLRLGTRVLFLSGFVSDVFVEQAIRLKASGYLLKGEPASNLIASIKAIATGEVRFSKEVDERVVFDSYRKRYLVRSESRLSALTNRQLEVLRHLARGRSVKEVAKMMHLSEKSVDSHKYRIMHKLGIHDRVELARYAIREGLTLP